MQVQAATSDDGTYHGMRWQDDKFQRYKVRVTVVLFHLHCAEYAPPAGIQRGQEEGLTGFDMRLQGRHQVLGGHWG